MANYKITKYKGVTKIKDLKTGNSKEIDIESFMGGGKKTEPGTEGKKKLTKEEREEINRSTGVAFTEEGANQLFETQNRMVQPEIADLNMGRYGDVGYYNTVYANGKYNLEPTAKNPGNYVAYKDNLKYIQELNPGLEINMREGYVPTVQRLEYGGSYAEGGIQEECEPWDMDCMQRRNLLTEEQLGYSNSSPVSNAIPMNSPKEGYDYYNDPEGVMMGQRQARPQVSTISQLQSQGVQGADPTAPFQEGQRLQNVDTSGLESYVPQVDRTKPAQEQNYNMFNPYAGVDIPTAAYGLGQSIENKDTLGTILNSTKLATGLGRNIVGGIGQQNRYNQVMMEANKDIKRNRNQFQSFAYGGKKDEEFATGEFIRGIDNEEMGEYNAEIEKGEYFQTNEGDIAEVVGKKHSSGGEKLQMEPEDRVVSDKLKIGGSTAKYLRDKYDLKLKAKNTYSDVLDKFRKKIKLDKVIDQEAELLKTIDAQQKVEDPTTRDFNLQVLAQKQKEIEAEKSPLEEQRKDLFDELFNLQEESKPKGEKQKDLAYGGNLESLAKEYGYSMDEAKKIVEKYNDGGKKGSAKAGVPEGQSKTAKGFYGDVSPEQYEKFVMQNSSWFDFSNFDPSDAKQVKTLQETYNNLTTGNKVKEDGLFGEQTASLFLTEKEGEPEIPLAEEPIAGQLAQRVLTGQPAYTAPPQVDAPLTTEKERAYTPQLAGSVLFPNETPMQPTALQGTLKNTARLGREVAFENDVTPYLQSIGDREQTQIQNTEGLSPSVRNAVLANIRAQSQGQESQVRNQIDVQNLQNRQQVENRNVSLANREQLLNNNYNAQYENRIYTAQAKTDFDINNYYNKLQENNSQRYRDLEDLNLLNARNEDVAYIPGRGYVRKNTDEQLFDQLADQYRR